MFNGLKDSKHEQRACYEEEDGAYVMQVQNDPFFVQQYVFSLSWEICKYHLNDVLDVLKLVLV